LNEEGLCVNKKDCIEKKRWYLYEMWKYSIFLAKFLFKW
jgi:hypothetical protein